MSSFDQKTLRRVFGHVPTSVAAITASSRNGPAGMVVGTVTSVSMDPPLMSFSIMKSSRAWAAIREDATLFGVNMLAADQEEVCHLLMRPPEERFDDLAWTPDEHGLPQIGGSLAWIVCSIRTVLEAGDHDIVIGDVQDLRLLRRADPMTFVRGSYSRLPLGSAG